MGSEPADQTGAGSITVAGATARFSLDHCDGPLLRRARRLPAGTAVVAHTGLVGQGDRHRADRRGRCGEPDRHKFVGRSEIFVVTIELAILAVFVVLGLTRADPTRFAAGLLNVTYEGFGVVTNSAGDMRKPARELPRAMYLALGIVIVVYVLVSALIVMTLTLPAMEANQGHVLSEAGQHILGRVGFVVIAVAPVAYSSPLPSPPPCCSSRLPRSGRWPALRVPHRLRHGQPRSPTCVSRDWRKALAIGARGSA
jgi:hypothetical protein